MRSSHNSDFKEEVLSEKSDNLSGMEEGRKPNEKEIKEAQREAERRRVVAAKLTDERTRVRTERIGSLMEDRDSKKHTPEFVNKYFGSFSGKNFLTKNPPIEVPPEVMTRM